MINPFLDRLDSQNIILYLLSESLLLQQTKWEKVGTVSEFINIHHPLNFQLLFSPSAVPGCPSPLILLYFHQSNGETYMGVEVRGRTACWFCSSTIWLPRIKLGMSDLAGAFCGKRILYYQVFKISIIYKSFLPLLL